MIEDHDADRVALIEGDVVLTYGELRDRIAAARARLAAAGVGPGSHVVLAAGNEIGFVIATFATLGLGAFAAPVNPYAPVAEVRRKIQPLNAVVMIVGEVAPHLRDDPESFGLPLLSTDDLHADGEAPAIVEVDGDAPSFLLSTSGVSGTPKVAVLTHDGMAWVQQSVVGDGHEQLGPDDIALCVLPVAHVLGLNLALLATLRAGGGVVLQRRFDSTESLELIRRHAITMVVGAPPMWHQWAVGEEPSDAMASVRFARSGAAALRPSTVDRLEGVYGLRIRQGYGLTETSAVVTTGRGLDAPVTSVGKVLPGVELVLVDDDGGPVDVGDVGEVVIRTPGSFAGYLDDPESTELVLTDDGWLWTGDLGVLDDDGFLHLVDRVKDIVIVSGFNVYPAEVEDVLMDFPGVRAAVVVGGAHGVTGETVVAHISGEVDEAELDAWARSQLASYKCPTSYVWVDQVPQTSTGKAVRRELRS